MSLRIVLCAVAAATLAWPAGAAGADGPPPLFVKSGKDQVKLRVTGSYCWIPADSDAGDDTAPAERCVDRVCPRDDCDQPQGTLDVRRGRDITIETRIRALRVVVGRERASMKRAGGRLWTWRVPAELPCRRLVEVAARYPGQPERYRYGPVRLSRDCGQARRSAEAAQPPVCGLVAFLQQVKRAITALA